MRGNRGLVQDGSGAFSEKWSNSGPIFQRELIDFPDWVDACVTVNSLACFPYKTLNSVMTGQNALLSLDPLH